MSILPKKIDDNLKDAIVNVQFLPNVPQETVVGYFHSMHREELVSTPSQNKLNFLEASISFESSQPYFVTRDERFRIDVNGQSITFNLLGQYAGWNDYFPVVSKYLKSLFDLEIIKEVQRISIRYINQFDGVRIYEHLVGSLSINSVPENSRGQTRIEFQEDDYLTVITLVNGYPATAINSDSKPETEFSLIDIDIIKGFPPRSKLTFEESVGFLEKAHDLEKIRFFSLLKKEFLETLNPQY